MQREELALVEESPQARGERGGFLRGRSGCCYQKGMHARLIEHKCWPPPEPLRGITECNKCHQSNKRSMLNLKILPCDSYLFSRFSPVFAFSEKTRVARNDSGKFFYERNILKRTCS